MPKFKGKARHAPVVNSGGETTLDLAAEVRAVQLKMVERVRERFDAAGAAGSITASCAAINLPRDWSRELGHRRGDL